MQNTNYILKSFYQLLKEVYVTKIKLLSKCSLHASLFNVVIQNTYIKLQTSYKNLQIINNY